MKKLVTILITAVALASCGDSKKSETMSTTKENQTQVSLIGKKAVLTYPEMTAEVHYISENEIHWKTTDKEGKTADEKNPLVLKPISGTQFFVNWIENDGTTVSQVVDVEKKTVTVFLTYADENGKRLSQSLEGTFELKN